MGHSKNELSPAASFLLKVVLASYNYIGHIHDTQFEYSLILLENSNNKKYVFIH